MIDKVTEKNRDACKALIDKGIVSKVFMLIRKEDHEDWSYLHQSYSSYKIVMYYCYFGRQTGALTFRQLYQPQHE